MKVTFLSPKKREILVILLAFIFVLSIYLIGIRQSSKSTAHERQNQTLEISRQIYENGFDF
jgi:ABC-type Na+ efflux pump permease subunit